MNHIKLFEEYLQQADKLYFNTGKLSKEDRDLILSITKGDAYTRAVTDYYFFMKKYYFLHNNFKDKLEFIYDELKNYNKNVFPIKGFDINKNFIIELEKRQSIIETLNKLPSIAKRNLKDEIRKERSYSELSKYENDITYFYGIYSQIFNRDEKLRENINKKIFRKGYTLNDWLNFVDDKYNLLDGFEFTKDYIEELIETEDINKIYDKDNVMILEVYSVDAITKLGCNSLWCFTYGNDHDYRMWYKYSYNDMIYAIINFNEESNSEQFMYVLIKPLEDEEFYEDEDNEDKIPLFNMANENYWNPYNVLEKIFKDEYEEIINEYLTFE